MPPKDDAAVAATDPNQTDPNAAAADAGAAGDASGDATVQTPTPDAEQASSTTAVGTIGVPSLQFRAPEGCTALFYAGTEYDLGENGLIELPAEAAGVLAAHGFEVV